MKISKIKLADIQTISANKRTDKKVFDSEVSNRLIDCCKYIDEKITIAAKMGDTRIEFDISTNQDLIELLIEQYKDFNPITTSAIRHSVDSVYTVHILKLSW